MDYHALEHMTVVQLRDEAKKHGFAGVTAMKKDELITTIAEKLGLEKPARKPKKKKSTTPVSKDSLKKKIVNIRTQQQEARSNNDKKKVDLLRRRLHLLKRQMRRIA